MKKIMEPYRSKLKLPADANYKEIIRQGRYEDYMNKSKKQILKNIAFADTNVFLDTILQRESADEDCKEILEMAYAGDIKYIHPFPVY